MSMGSTTLSHINNNVGQYYSDVLLKKKRNSEGSVKSTRSERLIKIA